MLGFMAVALLAFMGLAVVAIDFGHLGVSADEVQTIADAGAIAGARSLLRNRQGQSENVVSVVQAVVGRNKVDGATASIATSDIETGTWDFGSHSFSGGGASPNAMRATGRATVANQIAGVFGARTTAVTRQAIAAFSGNSAERPICPIAVGLCQFQQFQQDENCSKLPKLNQAPSGSDSSGWTSLSSSAASASEASRFLPAACGGGGLTPPVVRIGDTINVMSGQANSVLQTMESCFKAGLLTECTVPIVDTPCGASFNQAQPVVAFATFKIKSLGSSGGKKGITMDGICKSTDPYAGGGPDLGTSSVKLVM